MAGDIKSIPYSIEKVHQFVFLCKQWPELRLVYQRKERNGDPPEKYIGFLRTAAGGIFQTNNEEVAKFIRDLEQFSGAEEEFKKILLEQHDNDYSDFEAKGIWELSHDFLGRLLRRAPASGQQVVQGPVGTVQGQKPKREPVAPLEEPPAEPVASKGPRRRTPAEA